MNKNKLFNNQQIICEKLYQLSAHHEGRGADEIGAELSYIADEISCIGTDVNQLVFVVEEIDQLFTRARSIIKKTLKVL